MENPQIKGGSAAIACVLFFLVLEGFCSFLSVAHRFWASQDHETPSTKYDETLGWVGIPNFYEKDYYAPDTYVRINSRGFRANEEYTDQVPPGKLRIICSGDSFTFGNGVDNDHTWCQFLGSIDNRIQPVNLGESGYGIDQMYLRYRQDGSMLEHDVHVFALITEDFRRMQATAPGGYGKPVLKLRNGQLVAGNTPVPKPSRFLPWVASTLSTLRQLKFVAALAWLAERVAPVRDSGFSNGPTAEQRQILDKLLDDLQAIEKQKNSVLVLLYLPYWTSDVDSRGPGPAWRTWVRGECGKRGIALIDLIDDFQKLPVPTRDGLFIWPGSPQYSVDVSGHYDDQGHEWVARELYARLTSIPKVAEKLGVHDSEPAKGQRGSSAYRVKDHGLK